MKRLALELINPNNFLSFMSVIRNPSIIDSLRMVQSSNYIVLLVIKNQRLKGIFLKNSTKTALKRKINILHNWQKPH
ncbi:MAG: hypothetical protein L6Q37_11020 [Bdellovibrionaceae bacterium]|nr:hypothetical protein [Pseudobdellovibrionaceae bacterium]NUM60136.1 hypothetical protein [Pseudobdellovibrionaceae bacterium]